MGEKINVKEIVARKKEELKEKVLKLKEKGINPKLAVVLASDDEASKIYVGKKRKMCEELGVEQEEYIFGKEATTEEVVRKVKELNEDKSVNGILVQLPLYHHIDMDEVWISSFNIRKAFYWRKRDIYTMYSKRNNYNTR